MKRFLSLGAGVQSSTLALMISHGELPPIDGAIFADTGDEPKNVYEWLDFLESKVNFPIHRIGKEEALSESSTRIRTSKSGRTYLATAVPIFIKNAKTGKTALFRRECTAHHKIHPINNFVKKIVTPKRGQKNLLVEMLIGISLDEYQRMKPAKYSWIQNKWPLVDLRMTRQDCINWMQKNGYPRPPKSSCVFCPYRDSASWEKMKNDFPEDFAKAVAYEKKLQLAFQNCTALVGTPFIHRSMEPLDKADFTNKSQKSFFDDKELDAFNNECEGMCGV